MESAIDAAGRREISPAAVQGEWEHRHGITFPVPPVDAPDLGIEGVRDLIEAGREERAE
jgi:hypothetical protein